MKLNSGVGRLGMNTGMLEPTFCQIGIKVIMIKHMRYPENTELEDCMISGPIII